MRTLNGCRLLSTGLLALAGCSSSLAPGERADISVSYHGAGLYAIPAQVVVTLQFGGKQVAITDKDFVPSFDAGYTAPVRAFRAPASGNVHTVLRSTSNEIIAQGSRALTIDGGWQYGVDVWVARPDPRTLPWVVCVPSVQGFAVAVPYRSQLGDSVFISWGGIPRGAVC